MEKDEKKNNKSRKKKKKKQKRNGKLGSRRTGDFRGIFRRLVGSLKKENYEKDFFLFSFFIGELETGMNDKRVCEKQQGSIGVG